jgi:carbon-monoxide dehydrogenase large subunit
MDDSGAGTRSFRREDERLIRGSGRYVGDLPCPDALHGVFLRSPHASAAILGVDAGPALEMPGVVAVYTAADLAAAGVADSRLPMKMPRVGGGVSTETPRPLLARDVVRFIGEPVALVVADSRAIAQDAADAIAVDYEEMPAVITLADAAAENAPLVWSDRPGNIGFHWGKGDNAALDAALAASSHVTRLNSRSTRVAAMPMEPRGALAIPEDGGRMTLHASTQSPHQMRDQLCALFGLDAAQVRVVAGDVGGSFGLKIGLGREEAIAFWAARRLGRPVRWIPDRSESVMADDHARDIDIDAELGLDAQGRFTALRVRYRINIGAYASAKSGSAVGNFGGIAGVYATPLIVGEAIGYLTHTQTTAAYRGAGRPDATYAIERVIDVAAAELGIDPAELRRRNLIPAGAMPYATPFVFTYDCGDFARNMEHALHLAGYAGFEARRRQALGRGRLRGIGLANPIEVAAGPYNSPASDHATLRVARDGTVTLFSGAMSVGQGLETALPRLVAQRLGIAPERVVYVQGDTAAIPRGHGNGGSAAITLGGSAVVKGVDEIIAKMKTIASEALEASEHDLEFADGECRVVGSDHRIGLGEAAALAEADGIGGLDTLDGSADFRQTQPTYPNGCHVCEVEIDPETGKVDVLSYVGVEDVGRVLNPVLVEGQIHGGVVQGIGQVLQEEIRFDENGQLLSGSFMDYAMPRASDMPPIVAETLETPTALNPLGVKGVGEAGTVGALSAAMNAVCNALAPLGIRHLDMPATPLRVWQAIRDAKG